MKKLLLSVVLLAQGSALAQGPQPIRLKEAIADFPRSQLQLKTNGPVSIEVNQGERAAYEKLAEIAGLNIMIDPDFPRQFHRAVSNPECRCTSSVRCFICTDRQLRRGSEQQYGPCVAGQPDQTARL